MHTLLSIRLQEDHLKTLREQVSNAKTKGKANISQTVETHLKALMDKMEASPDDKWVKKPKTAQTAISLDIKVAQRLQALSDATGIGPSTIMRMAVEAAVEAASTGNARPLTPTLEQ